VNERLRFSSFNRFANRTTKTNLTNAPIGRRRHRFIASLIAAHQGALCFSQHHHHIYNRRPYFCPSIMKSILSIIALLAATANAFTPAGLPKSAFLGQQQQTR
jgi:hypothetical protein